MTPRETADKVGEDKPTVIIWQDWADSLAEFEEPLEIKRGGPPQERDGLNEIFP